MEVAVNWNQAALELLLKGDQAGLTKLAQLAHQTFSPEHQPCPECNHPGPHMDNGGRAGKDLALLCSKCGNQWDA
jgi:hypothetical protein